jgi:hypothetical protein
MQTPNPEPQTEENREKRAGDPPPPRGNPDADRETVDRGQEQLDKVSGN